MEIILFKKYLIRTDEMNYRLSSVRDGKDAIIMKREDGSKDYSNFSSEVYPTSFSQCLQRIKEHEIKTSNVEDLDQLVDLLESIDQKIEAIRKKFER